MIAALHQTVDLVWPETGASEDLPHLFGPTANLPLNQNAEMQRTSNPTPKTAITPPVPQPPQTPPPQPLPTSAPTAPLSAFPPPPPLAAPLKPSTPTILPPTQPSLPYANTKVITPSPSSSPITIMPATSSLGGSVIEVTKETPAWLRIMMKVFLSLIVVGITAGLLFGGYTGIQNNPELLAKLPIDQMMTLFQSTSWVVPGMLLGVGMVFIVIGYFIQKSNER